MWFMCVALFLFIREGCCKDHIIRKATTWSFNAESNTVAQISSLDKSVAGSIMITPAPTKSVLNEITPTANLFLRMESLSSFKSVHHTQSIMSPPVTDHLTTKTDLDYHFLSPSDTPLWSPEPTNSLTVAHHPLHTQYILPSPSIQVNPVFPSSSRTFFKQVNSLLINQRSSQPSSITINTHSFHFHHKTQTPNIIETTLSMPSDHVLSTILPIATSLASESKSGSGSGDFSGIDEISGSGSGASPLPFTSPSSPATTEVEPPNSIPSLPLPRKIMCVDTIYGWCLTVYACFSIWDTAGNIFHQTCLRRSAQVVLCSMPFFELEGPKVGDCCFKTICSLNPTFPSIIPSTEPITEVTDPPTMDPSLLTKPCYQKSVEESTPTFCEAGQHGCFETERHPFNKPIEIEMGCLQRPCQPIRAVKKIRQCCNTSLCNNLHERDPLFLPSPLPTLPPRPLPQLPTVNPTLLEIDGGLLCVSPAHPPYEACLSPYGCYRLYDALTLEVLNLTCIESPDFKLCAREYVVFDDRFAECCYHHHYCNEHRKVATPPRETDIVTTVSMMPPTTDISPTTDNSPTDSETFSKSESEVTDEDTPGPVTLDSITIVAIALGSVGSLIVILFVIFLGGVYCYSFKERIVREAPIPQFPMPPPPGPDESQTVTMPIEYIDFH